MAIIRRGMIILMLLLSATTSVFSQSLPDSVTTKIDSLFKKWDKPNSPGYAIGIIRNDSLIYAKGYGMANLEYDVSLSPETIFHMASISKQITAYSIVLLEKQGRLRLDDDIRKYLKWFPDLKQKITIRNLLNHTSGIRDQWQLLAIAGTRLDDVITQEHIIKVLSKQQALNFNPGEKYSYSNSGFTMLAEIVKSVTGQSLRKFTDSAIFKPLGMNNTHFHDDYTEIVKNRAYSYRQTGSTNFANSILSYSNAGATSLFTNIIDLSKWVMNFYKYTVGTAENINTLTQKGKLNNGKDLPYALGISVNTYNGWKQYSHGGADAGYRTNLSVFPDLKMGFIVFGNLANLDPGSKTYDLANIFIKDTTQKKPETSKAQSDSLGFLSKDGPYLQRFLGNYISEEGLQINFNIANNKLYYHTGNENNFLIKESKDNFSAFRAPNTKFSFSIRGKDTIADLITATDLYHLKKIIKGTAQTEQVLKTYTGVYYCPELDCKYGIELKDHHLFLVNVKYNDAKLTLIDNNHLTNDYWWINHFIMTRDNENKITGFQVNSGRTMHLKFNKIE